MSFFDENTSGPLPPLTVNLEHAQKLTPFRPPMERFQIEPELAKAFLSAQRALKPALKDAKNDHLKSKYADLASVWEACRDALHDNGLAVSQVFAHREGGVCVITRIYHAETGYEMPPSECFIPVDTEPTRTIDYKSGQDKITAKNFAQAYGSTATYARRYGLAAMLGVVTEDDDGHAAGGNYRPEPAAVGKKSDAPRWKKAWEYCKDRPELMAWLKMQWHDQNGDTDFPPFKEMSDDALDWVSAMVDRARKEVPGIVGGNGEPG